jgi:hypothetical protein
MGIFVAEFSHIRSSFAKTTPNQWNNKRINRNKMARPFNKKQREEKKKLFLEALEESRGMITTSAAAVGVTRETIDNWRKADQEFDKAINEIKEHQKEWVQGKLMTLIENGNTSATIFFLKTQCGWKESQKLEVENLNDIDVQAAINEIREQMKTKGE